MHEKTIETVKGLETDLGKIEPVSVHTRAAINALIGVRSMLGDDERVREQMARDRQAAEAKALEAARKLVSENPAPATAAPATPAE